MTMDDKPHTPPYPVVGILGGMGPAATAGLYRAIIDATPAARDQDHLAVVVWADPAVPDRTEALLAGGRDPTPWLIFGAQQLKNAGASIVAMPCNTAHAFLPAVTAAVDIAFVDMIDETVQAIAREHADTRRVAVLATDGTVASRLYHDRLSTAGIQAVDLAPQTQAGLMTAIREVKAGQSGAAVAARFTAATKAARASGAELVVAACTELSILVDAGARSDLPVVDAAAVLARATVTRALALRAEHRG